MKLSGYAIKLCLSVGLLALFAMRMDEDAVQNVLHHIDASAWIYASLLIIGQFCILSFRWMLLLNIGRRHLDFPAAAKITLASLLANLLLITSVGGVFVRIAMAVQYGATLLKAFIATAVDRMMTLAALVVLSALFLPYLGDYLENDTYRQICLWVGTFILTLFLFTPFFLRFIIKTLPRFSPGDRRIRFGVRYLVVLLRNNRIIGLTVSSSLLAQTSYFMAVYFICLSTGAQITLLQLMTVLPVIALVASLPLSIGGWGLREGAFIFGLGLLNVPMETAFLISVQIGLIGMIATLLAGLPMIMTLDLDTIKIQARTLTARISRYSRHTK